LQQHIRRLDADTDDARQHSNHGMPASGRRRFQPLAPSLLDGVEVLADPSQSGHVALQLIQQVGRNRRLLWSLRRVEPLRRRKQSGLKAANTESDRLAAMQELDLVYPEVKSGNYAFRHALLRDALYQSLLTGPRTAWRK
jgi:hypothetical protein